LKRLHFRFNKTCRARIQKGRQREGRPMNARQERDEWLMAQVARGRRDQLEPLIRRYAGRLLTFIQRMTGDRHQSEELFQEVFLAVWVKRRQYEFPRPFRSWLYAIAANKCHAAARGRRLTAFSFEDEPSWGPPASDPSPEDTLVATETAALVAAAVTRLPPQQRAVVVLRIWEGMSYAEIAEAVGRSEATVRSHMHHGLAALRKYLEPRLR
jgi:RNA polymerase sigma-70 factor (ECF subfamily)